MTQPMNVFFNAVRDGDFQNPWNSASGAGAVTSFTLAETIVGGEPATVEETTALTPNWEFLRFASQDETLGGAGLLRSTSSIPAGLPANLRTALRVTPSSLGTLSFSGYIQLIQRNIRLRQFAAAASHIYCSFWGYSVEPRYLFASLNSTNTAQTFQLAPAWNRYAFAFTPTADVADLKLTLALYSADSVTDWQALSAFYLTGFSIGPELPDFAQYFRNVPASQEFVSLPGSVVGTGDTTVPHGLGVTPSDVIVTPITAIAPALVSKDATNVVLAASGAGTADLLLRRP